MPTNCLLIVNQVNELATSLIAQLLGAEVQVIMLVEDASAPEHANPLPGLHLYRIVDLASQAVAQQMLGLQDCHGELQHMLYCSSASSKRVSGSDMERGRFWTSCFSHYRQQVKGDGSMMLLHKNVNQHQSSQRLNALPGLSRWWAKQVDVTGLRCNSLNLQGYNNSQLHAQTGSLIRRLMQQQYNGCHYQLYKGEVSVSSSPATGRQYLSLL